jgi:hypothetical protein
MKRHRSDRLPRPLCACGCGQEVRRPSNTYIGTHVPEEVKLAKLALARAAKVGKPNPRKMERPFCACGCGERVRLPRRRYVEHHWSRHNAAVSASHFPHHKGPQAHNWAGGVHTVNRWYDAVISPDGSHVYVHRGIAEVALGRPLVWERSGRREIAFRAFPEHPYDTGNMVIGTEDYRALLQRRARALLATGDPNKCRCGHCRTWDHPDSMHHRRKANGSTDTSHRECAAYEAHLRKNRLPIVRGEGFRRAALQRKTDIANERRRNAERRFDRPIRGKGTTKNRPRASDSRGGAIRRFSTEWPPR